MEQFLGKILLVDDEHDILEFLSYNLSKEGYEVFTSTGGKEAIQKAKDNLPDLIVLDVMMPEMDGVEMCKELRSIDTLQNALIIFLTARGEDYSQIAGLEAGADDYINKPIKPRVFVSKIKSLLRRKEAAGASAGSGEDSEEGIQIDAERYEVRKNNENITLPKKEFELLALLASKKGKVFTRSEILEKVWGDDVVVGDRTIDVHIRKLREKLGNTIIKTIKGVGYRYEM